MSRATLTAVSPRLAGAVALGKDDQGHRASQRCRATLVVAMLDRLARNVAFTSALMESGVDFVACDNPHANRLTIHILAAVAEDEARRISERTQAALEAAKRRGVTLGAARPASSVRRTSSPHRTGAVQGFVPAPNVSVQAAKPVNHLGHGPRQLPIAAGLPEDGLFAAISPPVSRRSARRVAPGSGLGRVPWRSVGASRPHRRWSLRPRVSHL